MRSYLTVRLPLYTVTIYGTQVDFIGPEFNKSGGPAGHQVRILFGPAEIYTLPVRMSDTIFLQY